MNQLNVFILTARVSEQDSVDMIDRNLTSCYLNLLPDAKIITLYNEQDKSSALFNFQENLKLILKSSHNLIIVTNPYVYKHLFFRMLLKFSKTDQCIYLAHILGDFIKNSEQYLTLEDLLIGKEVIFLPPSNAYSKVIQPFFKNSNNLFSLHIPLFDIIENNKQNKQSKELLFLYTGRIIAEKNLNQAYEILLSLDIPFKFVAVGEIDDFSRSAILNNSPAGKLFSTINKNIEIIGHADRDLLKQYYQKANFFISLSTFHDESYGISPLEALFQDTPCILTAWGGFRDILDNFSNETFPINVKYQDGKFKFEYNLLALKKFIREKKCISTNKISKSKYESEIFLNSISNLLKNDISPFVGFSEKLSNVVINNVKSKRIKKLEHKLSAVEYINIYSKMWE